VLSIVVSTVAFFVASYYFILAIALAYGVAWVVDKVV